MALSREAPLPAGRPGCDEFDEGQGSGEASERAGAGDDHKLGFVRKIKKLVA